MKTLNIAANDLTERLLCISEEKKLHLLDSCGCSETSRFLIAGFEPVAIVELKGKNAQKTLDSAQKTFNLENSAFIFTVSYEFGLKLNDISQRRKEFPEYPEPDFSIAIFDVLLVHDYRKGETFLIGNEKRFDTIERELEKTERNISQDAQVEVIFSDFDRAEYEKAVERIKEFIRCGETYQTNLTRKIWVRGSERFLAEAIFRRIRQEHPVPFAAILRRKNDSVVSASPERFFRIEGRKIVGSPIKGTRRRGKNEAEDERLKLELADSEKDRAENVMIVDLVRNDFGRICEFGSVEVEKLCEIETYATLFQMVSTVSGKLRFDVSFADILCAVFPCGSITGAPKIRTMQIIDLLERSNRGISMGAIGYRISPNFADGLFGNEEVTDCSVAIRTMNIKDNEASFKVGGGIVIDSDPSSEYGETETKSKALLKALDAISQEVAIKNTC